MQNEFLKIVFKHINLEIEEKKEEKDKFEEDIFKKFLDECTIETKKNISNVELYNAFIIWFNENIINQTLPSKHFF